MKIQKRKMLAGLVSIILLFVVCGIPFFVEAQAIPKLENPLKFNSVEGLVTGLVDIALQLGVVVAALSLIWVGFKYVAARGNPKKIEEAHQALLYTIIGIAILFGAKVIVEIIKGTLQPLAPELFRNIP